MTSRPARKRAAIRITKEMVERYESAARDLTRAVRRAIYEIERWRATTRAVLSANRRRK